MFQASFIVYNMVQVWLGLELNMRVFVSLLQISGICFSPSGLELFPCATW